ncbi:Re/Si-specific NAD(P)(+) transhydrogenase subunit alpha [Candidatus Paracaedibacter symbiosus]|uniref:Re/Si-specific NAD(P)(+) transhydrogenase subunit alpha n=1 Tax=Candidatus Paracaedibacter symbiosus TaxID=244582 RepID=UPI00050974DF|nr:Re/Si-specific NAD(P)(+) transhydrogenase subunit alpha [Candidatus Paracaedibacter symbiosus]
MKILVLKETDKYEKRVAISPEVTKKLIEMGFDVLVEKDAGKESGMVDDAYEAAGAKIVKDAKTMLPEADIIPHVAPISIEELQGTKENVILMSLLKPYSNQELLKKLANHKVTSIALEMIPRISRAQAMDVLSSQSNLAGYKAVVDAASEYGRAMPLMMTAAGTIAPARVLVIGAGVAGLQAIATARRLGSIVSAFDVRAVAKEQVESLGANFVEVESTETGDGSGGYAKEMSDEYKQRQSEKLASVIKTQDIIITTAQIPGKKAPILITADMAKSMRPGSIIVDLAVESGGNCELAEFGKTVVKNGVKIIGHANILSSIAQDASQVFAKNVLNLLKIMMNKGGNAVELNFEDEIIKGACLTHGGSIIHPGFGEKI